MKCYFEKLKDYNLKLKAKKQEVCITTAATPTSMPVFFSFLLCLSSLFFFSLFLWVFLVLVIFMLLYLFFSDGGSTSLFRFIDY